MPTKNFFEKRCNLFPVVPVTLYITQKQGKMKNLFAIFITLITFASSAQINIPEIVDHYNHPKEFLVYTDVNLTDVTGHKGVEMVELNKSLTIKLGHGKGAKVKLKGMFDIFKIEIDKKTYFIYFLQNEAINGNMVYDCMYINRIRSFNKEGGSF